MSVETERQPLPISYGADGLVPAVIQAAESGQVLMVGFMNEAALDATRSTGRVHFWSRSRGRLWRKGETSGHEQLVEAIHVNCEQNSLLIHVRQTGAVCHEGYPTCFYRQLETDGSLIVDSHRAFDPLVVYGDAGASGLAPETRLLYGAYAFLRDHELSAVSGTSARLHAPDDQISGRIADELAELAGVLDGTHRHAGTGDDVVTEGSQVIYWVILAALRAGLTWDELRPDRALLTVEPEVTTAVASGLLRADAAAWQRNGAELSARCHATLALVAQACHAGGIEPRTLIERDLASLRQRPYLATYFADAGAA